MAKKCGHTDECGCKDTALEIPANFSNDPAVCPDPEPCSELFDMACICYNGPPIVDLGINPGDRFDDILQILILGITNPGCILPGNACISALNVTTIPTVCTSNSITVTWDLSATAVNYQVEYKESTGSTWLLLPIVGPTVTQDTMGGLTPDTWYDIRVNAICASGNCYSLTMQIKTDPT